MFKKLAARTQESQLLGIVANSAATVLRLSTKQLRHRKVLNCYLYTPVSIHIIRTLELTKFKFQNNKG